MSPRIKPETGEIVFPVGRHWTDEEIVVLWKRYGEGDPTPQIQAAIDREQVRLLKQNTEGR